MTLKCAVVTCPWNATERGFCATHAHYFGVVLADDKYRSTPVPGDPMLAGYIEQSATERTER